MKRITAALVALTLFLSFYGQGNIFAQEPKDEGINVNGLISKVREAKDWQSSFNACQDAISQCKTYDDYEKIASEIRKIATNQKDYKFIDVLYYMIAKARMDELSYLAKKNDIESGRAYMSVNEKYSNEAVENLDKADQSTKSKDLALDICYPKFFIYKEQFQQAKADAAFNDMVARIASYSGDKAKNIAKLNEMSARFGDKGMADYGMKLKFVYASKVDPDSAKMLADEIRSGGDKYLEEGNVKSALSTYDTFIELAEKYYDKDSLAAKIMDIAEKYFNKNRYKEAIKYYALYLSKYAASQVADYAAYKLALSYYHDKDFPNAVSKFMEFLTTYQNSVWFEKGFETLCRLYYETSNAENAIQSLQKLIEAYPRRDTTDYAYLLIGIIYYGKPDYDKALETFQKIQRDFPKSSYLYTTETLIADIKEIKKGQVPSYSFGSKDVYKVWESYTPIGATVTAGEGAETVENKNAKPGEIYIKTKAGSKVTFTVSNLEDLDRFNEYWQDKEDESRLPREMKSGTEKDLIFFTWSNTDKGIFLEDKQAASRVWQAPDTPGDYVITINAHDLALVRPPDSGTRKDQPKTLTVHVMVGK